MMQMPKPGEAQAKLARLAGRWLGTERLSPSPWDSKGGTAVGRCENRIAADGFALAQNYQQERGGLVSFCGHGVFSYDPAEKCYLLHWWDSMGMGTSVFKGDFAGDTLRMTCRLPQGCSCWMQTIIASAWKFPAMARNGAP
jgi:Protein of unknown function (DUF1579)